MRIASSSVEKRNSGARGPNVSSRATAIAGVTPVRRVGWKKLPPRAWRPPPVTTSAPRPTASAMCSSTFATARRSIKGPCSVPSSSPLPTRSAATLSANFAANASWIPS